MSITKKIKIHHLEQYFKDINYLNNIDLKYEKLMIELVKRTNDQDVIIINKNIKIEISKTLNKTLKTINQYISNMKKLNILNNISRSSYILNKKRYGDCDWKFILNNNIQLSIQIIYSNNNIVIK